MTGALEAEQFSICARRLAGQAGVLLGWRPDEFWRATPDELGDALGAFGEVVAPVEKPLDRGVMTSLMEKHPDG